MIDQEKTDRRDRQQEDEDRDDDTLFMSSFPGVLVAMVAGAIFETVYLIVGDLGIGCLIDRFGGGEMLVLGYVAIVAILGFCILTRCDISGIGFVIAAFLMHKFWEVHDSVVYYRLHGEFMPIADDMGYCFFLMMLGSIYVIWIPAVIIAVIIKRKDESKISKEVEN